jgi:hypothetical protein
MCYGMSLSQPIGCEETLETQPVSTGRDPTGPNRDKQNTKQLRRGLDLFVWVLGAGVWYLIVVLVEWFVGLNR